MGPIDDLTEDTNVTRRLILASSSPRRRELIGRLGLDVEIRPPRGVDESSVHAGAFETVLRLARLKAETALEQMTAEEGEEALRDAWVIGCDTVVALVRGEQERILGKPADEADARMTLGVLSGMTHRVLTGLAFARPGLPTREEVEVSHVTFKTLSEQTIAEYVASEDPLDKAGSYGIQSGGADLVESIRGCYYNIVGLPVSMLARVLEVESAITCDCASHPLQCGGGACRIIEGPSEEDVAIELRDPS